MVIGHGEKQMQKTLLAAAILFSGLVATAASATPMASFAKPTGSVVQIDYACGRGAHMTPYGHCRPNHWGPPPEMVYHHRQDDWHRDDWRRDGYRHDDRRRDYYNN
jgi:hypothetical protein